MRYDDFRRSDDIEDRRGDDSGGGGGGGIGLPMGGGGLGIATIIVLGLISYAFGIDPRILIGGAEVLNGGGSQAPSYQSDRRAGPVKSGAPTDAMGNMIAGILGEIDDRWSEIFQASGQAYTGPKIVLFRNATNGGRCGMAQSAMGPFYCPLDRKIYLDTSFFRDMKTRFGGGGDFAYAYVISHEMGHHIQNQLGILPKVHQAQERAESRAEANALSVRIELMADCLAGVWAANGNAKRQFLEQGDVEKAVATAQAIGDDRLQKASRGVVVPDSFTHGSSAQRVQWLQRGLQSGQIDSCNTFSSR